MNGGKLLFDRVDYICRRDRIKVKGSADHQRFGFKSEGFVDGDGHELLEKSGEGGRVDLLRRHWVLSGWWRVRAG